MNGEICINLTCLLWKLLWHTWWYDHDPKRQDNCWDLRPKATFATINFISIKTSAKNRFPNEHKYHSRLRAKRATFTFWVDKSSLKMPKMVHFGEFLKTWSLRSNSVTRHVSFNRTKIGGKCQDSIQKGMENHRKNVFEALKVTICG